VKLQHNIVNKHIQIQEQRTHYIGFTVLRSSNNAEEI